MNESLFFQDLAVLMAVVGAVSIIFTKLHWPKVIGYLFAGILMSEHTWGGSFLADPNSITTLGQLGIVFLMFTLGLEFSPGEMKKVKHVTIPTALFDSMMMIWLGYTVGRNLLGWNNVQSLFLGAAVCDSATTLLAKTIDEMKWSNRPFVRYIFGTTIFEDILCVGIIALITGVASGTGMDVMMIGKSLGGLAVFFIAVLVLGMIFVPRLLNNVGRMKDDESLLLTLLGCCFLVSFFAYKLDFSLALGAFLMGVLGSSSNVRSRLNKLASPLRSMFAATFFVTIGLLVDPVVCLRHFPAIFGLSLLVIFGKGFNCFFMSLLTGQRVKDAVQTGFGLAQIGEFAYMVALIYMSRTNDTTNPMYQIVVGVSLLTTCLNPLMLRISDPAGDWLEKHMPARMSGWLSAYADWLKRFRAANVPSKVHQRIRTNVIWLGVIAVLNFCISVAASMLDRLDYSNFSRFFEDHKRFFFCLAANFFCISMLAPLSAIARSLGHDIAQVLTGTRQESKWKKAVEQLVSWFVAAAVIVLAFVEIILVNFNIKPDELWARWTIPALLIAGAVFGWKHFLHGGQRAMLHFNQALDEEKNRSNAQSSANTLPVPHDFYEYLAISKDSPAIGETIRSLDIRAKTGTSVLSIKRNGEHHRNPGPTWMFEAGDVMAVIGSPEQIKNLRNMLKLETEKE